MTIARTGDTQRSPHLPPEKPSVLLPEDTRASGADQRQLSLALLASGEPAAQGARRFIEARYLQMFGAHAPVRYPNLLVLTDRQGRTEAALGLRRACEGPLFLEHYLAVPAEDAIAGLTGFAPGRDGLVELGGFAARSSRAATYLVTAMAAYMHHQGYTHALVTSTGRLRRLFAMFEFDLRCLGDAHRHALPDGGRSWGLYYDDAPRVLMGRVQDCHAAVLRDRDRQTIAARRATIDNLVLQARALASC